jgi:site-specific DNA-cytosine methylase|nr:MAG TPA: Cytosine specific methyltransferase [Caudoviricetes sp.]
MTHLSLFSGIGGLDLAAEWAGFETVGQCEFADDNSRIVAGHDGTRVLYDPKNPRTEIYITKMEENT